MPREPVTIGNRTFRSNGRLSPFQTRPPSDAPGAPISA